MNFENDDEIPDWSSDIYRSGPMVVMLSYALLNTLYPTFKRQSPWEKFASEKWEMSLRMRSLFIGLVENFVIESLDNVFCYRDMVDAMQDLIYDSILGDSPLVEELLSDRTITAAYAHVQSFRQASAIFDSNGTLIGGDIDA